MDAAVLQFVRKISNVRKPSAENQAAFDAARQKMAASVRAMLKDLRHRHVHAIQKATFKPL